MDTTDIGGGGGRERESLFNQLVHVYLIDAEQKTFDKGGCRKDLYE